MMYYEENYTQVFDDVDSDEMEGSKTYEVEVRYPSQMSICLKVVAMDPKSALERVFHQFNAGSGQECWQFTNAKIRSLSVFDFVRIDQQWYQCMSVGWKEATLQDLQELEDAVDEEMKKQPSYQRSAWAAIQEVMWQKRRALA